MEFLILLGILAAVVFVLTGPLRAGERRRELGIAPAHGLHPGAVTGLGDDENDRLNAELADLEAAREAKYREIRDTQLDHATGKLSDQDFRQVEDRLRAEALQILDGIEALTARAQLGRGGEEQPPE